MVNIREIIEEYKPDNSIWREDDDIVDKIKRSIENLDDADKIIFILYCETGSLRKVGKRIGVSHTTIYKEIKRIKNRILYDIGFINDNDNSMFYN